MAEIKRKAGAIWKGDLKSGTGVISTETKALFRYPYNFSTRFEDSKEGSNPEELLAAAHAACYSMAFAGELKKEGYDPVSITSSATCTISPLDEGGFEITKMDLRVHGEVPGLDQKTFEEISEKADAACPVSNLLREGLSIQISVELI